MNLLSVLPREIATLGGLHLTAIEGVFDSSPESSRLEYLMAEAETSTEFQLLDNLKLAKIGLQIVVESPTASPSLSGVITGEFKIGEAVVSVSASAPELRFSGALTSGEIKFVDLVKLFKPGVDS
ncbi:MAG: hypothetical protein WCH75_30390, partial [Candidatus Binatia bacterium]